jgi:hypothetical protein
MATPLSIPGIYQDVQEVSVTGADNFEIDFSDLPADHLLHIQEVTGVIFTSDEFTGKAHAELLGGSDGAYIGLVPSTDSVLIPPAHGGRRIIPLKDIVDFYTDDRPIVRVFLESSANTAGGLFTITGRLIKKN